MSRLGKFITLEGGEGTGKSTLIAALAPALRTRGRSVLVTREPGGTKLAEQVRAAVLYPPEGETWSPLGQALMMNAARDDHLHGLIRPALARGDWVICDRFADSTLAYQSVEGVAMATLRALQHHVVGDHGPDLTLILDAPPDALAARREGRGQKDVFEKRGLAFHKAIRQAFLDIAEDEPDRCIVLDATKPPQFVLEEARSAIADRLGEGR